MDHIDSLVPGLFTAPFPSEHQSFRKELSDVCYYLVQLHADQVVYALLLVAEQVVADVERPAADGVAVDVADELAAGNVMAVLGSVTAVAVGRVKAVAVGHKVAVVGRVKAVAVGHKVAVAGRVAVVAEHVTAVADDELAVAGRGAAERHAAVAGTGRGRGTGRANSAREEFSAPVGKRGSLGSQRTWGPAAPSVSSHRTPLYDWRTLPTLPPSA